MDGKPPFVPGPTSGRAGFRALRLETRCATLLSGNGTLQSKPGPVHRYAPLSAIRCTERPSRLRVGGVLKVVAAEKHLAVKRSLQDACG